MKKFVILLITIMATVCVKAQDVSQFKVLPDSAYLQNKAYQKGNKYQKDAILFIDMLADTHPYYYKKERRNELMKKKSMLVNACKSCDNDFVFVAYLIETLGKLHDKHTDVINPAQLEELKKQKDEKANAQEKEASEQGNSTVSRSIMAKHNSLFDYTIFDEMSICYLQFNQCVDARTMRDESQPRFDVMLDEMFQKMEAQHIETLVVDAQYNNGGSSMLCDELLIRLMPFERFKQLKSYIRFSDLMGMYNPRIITAKKAWEEEHPDELYPMPAGRLPENFVQPKVYEGKVVFVQDKKTYSSAGILMTLARDNGIGTIIGAESTFSPSHYGEIVPYRLPNTGVLGTISTKYFERPDKSCSEDESLIPDITVDLSNKEAAWQFIEQTYGKAAK